MRKYAVQSVKDQFPLRVKDVMLDLVLVAYFASTVIYLLMIDPSPTKLWTNTSQALYTLRHVVVNFLFIAIFITLITFAWAISIIVMPIALLPLIIIGKVPGKHVVTTLSQNQNSYIQNHL